MVFGLITVPVFIVLLVGVLGKFVVGQK